MAHLPKGQGIFLPPFKAWLASNIPAVYDNTMSYYEELVALIKYLQDIVVPAVNDNAAAVTAISEAQETLQAYVDNYFDNLDVQEEINNKLDQMAEDGTLQEIITTYIQSNVAWTFDTVADMQAATNLIAGSDAQTLGYYSIDDGGKSLYHITNSGTADGGKVIALTGGLYAHLIVKDVVYVEQFGAKGDGTTDDQDAINLAMQSGADVIKFIGGKTYAVRAYETGQPEGSGRDILSAITGVVIPSNKTVDMNFAKIKVISNNRKNYNAITIENADNVILKNGYIEGDVNTHTDNGGEWGYGISLRFAKNTVLDNLHISKCWGDGINLNNDGDAIDFNENVIIRNCICDDNRRQGMSIENANHLIVEDSKFINTGTTAYTAPGAGVDIEPAYDTAKNVTFINCEFNDNYNSGLLIDGDNIQNIVVDDCLFSGNKATTSGSILYVDEALDVKVTNCTFISDLSVYKTNVFSPGNDLVFENNRLFDIQCHLTGTKSTNAKHYFINNNFYVSIATAYNSPIELVGSSSSNKNELIIVGNSFENTSGNESLNIQSYVHGIYGKGYVKLTIKNNIFKFGRRVILAEIPAIIENNQFVACWNFPIVIQDHISDIATQIAIIKSNNFEVTGNQTGANYIISSQTAVPMVLLNNTYFTKALNSIDYSGNSFTPTRWYNNTPSNLTEANNNIVSI